VGVLKVTVITDMRLPDYPVIYASDSFEGLTLYEKADILGSNCRILQGKCTNKQTVEMLSAGIHSGEQVEAHLLNYRKDGTPFWNKFMALVLRSEREIALDGLSLFELTVCVCVCVDGRML
jgi:hypothetical protein